MAPKHLCLPLLLAATFALGACASTAPASSVQHNRPENVPACPPPATAKTSVPLSHAAPPPIPEPKPQVRSQAPFRYVVQPGDTLWDISAHFFQSPWLWPEIWYENPYIDNPHLIYPGDIITFTYVNGRPALLVSRNGTVVSSTAPGMRMLHPKVEHIPLGQAVPTIPWDEISALLSKPRVMTRAAYQSAAYVLRPVDGGLVAAAPNSIYVRDLQQQATPGTVYAVVRMKERLLDPESGVTLGYEVLYLGRASVTAAGDPAILRLTQSSREIHAGDRLVAAETGIVPTQFPLLRPCAGTRADIIDVLEGIYGVGQYQVVVLDRGTLGGLRIGDVMAVYTHGKTVRDPYAQGKLSNVVKLPNRRIGQLVIFRAFPEVSYALVMHATHAIKTGDLATAP